LTTSGENPAALIRTATHFFFFHSDGSTIHNPSPDSQTFFSKEFHVKRKLLVGGGIALEKFFLTPAEEWMS
jgi:hypothetical protein